jgi:hypothetical protein
MTLLVESVVQDAPPPALAGVLRTERHPRADHLRQRLSGPPHRRPRRPPHADPRHPQGATGDALVMDGMESLRQFAAGEQQSRSSCTSCRPSPA